MTDATEHVFNCPLTTNADFSVEIPIEAQSWLSRFTPEETKAIRNETIYFKTTANGGLTRYATVKLKDNGSLVQTLFVMQNGSGISINCQTAGSLSLLVPTEVADEMTTLTLTGRLNADDYTYLRSLISGKKLTEIDLSGLSDTEMPSSAFRDMTKLVKIIFPSGLTYFPEYVCHNCQNLVSINIPATVTEIRQYAFSSTNKLATTTGVNGEMFFPDNVEYIRNNAFSNNSIHYLITKLRFGSGLKEIGNGAFRSFDFVEEVTFNEGLSSIGEDAFRYLGFRNNDDAATSPRPAVVLPSSLRTIGANAFQYAKLSSLDLGTGVRTIGNSAFYGAKIAGDIVVPDNIEQILEYEFYGCTGFDGTLRLPVNAKFVTLYGWAFYGCNNLTGVVAFPVNLTYVGGYSFQNCSKLSGDLNLENVTRIDTQAFRGCTGLNGKVLLGSNLQYLRGGVFYECTGITKFQCKRATPPDVATDTFYGITATSLEVPVGAAAAYEAAATWINFAITEVSSF